MIKNEAIDEMMISKAELQQKIVLLDAVLIEDLKPLTRRRAEAQKEILIDEIREIDEMLLGEYEEMSIASVMMDIYSAQPTKKQRDMEFENYFESEFKAWADQYFAVPGPNVDRYIIKIEAYRDCSDHLKGPLTLSRFGMLLGKYITSQGFYFNPAELITEHFTNRIIARVTHRYKNKDGVWVPTGERQAKELFYIQTVLHRPLNKRLPGANVPIKNKLKRFIRSLKSLF